MQVLNTGSEIMCSQEDSGCHTLEVISSQFSLSEMFIQPQFSNLGPEEFGSVVRGVNPKKSYCTFYWQILLVCPPRLCLQGSWVWSHHSQRGNVIKVSFRVATSPENLLKWLRKTNCKTPLFLIPFLLIGVQPLFPIFPSSQKQNKVHYFSEEKSTFEVNSALFPKGRNGTHNAECSRAEFDTDVFMG